jgi:UDP-N-acetylglucosamine 2-epimerase (non-hydrolysing)
MHILHVVGARPNFVKVAPVLAALGVFDTVQQTVVHTGQHYDANLSDIFFNQLGIPAPDLNLEVGSGSHAVQTAQIMQRLEPVLLNSQPDRVLVYGDVNSTVAAALVCAKLLIPVGHVEAGLRSGDRTMPEEINRLVTDQLADLLFTPSTDGDNNLAQEGIPPERIHCVGNVMADTLLRLLPQADVAHIERPDHYALVTLHRPSNVEDPAVLRLIIETLAAIGRQIPLLFPVHPRTRRRLDEWGLTVPPDGSVRLMDPLGYLEFLALQKHAAFVVTDSGGVQEETTLLRVPCLTVRPNTERPITVSLGTNTLVGHDMALLKHETDRILAGHAKQGQIPPLWDGKASQRIADIICRGG